MNKLLALLLAIFTFSLASSVWADIPPQPANCPAIDPILKTAFFTAKKLEDGSYAAIQLGTYETPETWAFIVYKITATSAQDAMNKAKTALPSLSFNSGPLYYAEHQVWSCFYNLDSGYEALALTPIPRAVVNPELLFKAANIVR